MKRLSKLLMCLFALLAASLSAKAQEIVIDLFPGWNWISYPNAETMDIVTALGDFTPMPGDIINSQYSSTSYNGVRWRGGLTHFMPGWGYMYYSNRDEMVSFVFSLPPMPTGTLTVTTGELANTTSTTAACGGSAVSNDGTTILMKGVCWATHPQPTTNDSYTEDGNGPGAFTAEMTELVAETEYYVRAYAVSVKGINYGEELSFTTAPQGVLNGLFSVSENTQVCFSQGNLQYQASTNTWRFAENQWDYVGNGGNNNASPTYDGWIDLFAWGTSGYNHGAVCYQPWSISAEPSDYYAYGDWRYNLYDQNGRADWGYNSISNGGNSESSYWRTLKADEWDYLFNTRITISGIRYAWAVVNDINGLILVPDNWDVSYYTLNNTNTVSSVFSSNIISSSEWNELEQHGAIFLPGATWGEGGHYWSSNIHNEYTPYFLFFYPGQILTKDVFNSRNDRFSVRLVRHAQTNTSYSIEAVPNPTGGGTISGAGTYDYYAQVTLTATANEGYTFYQWKENGNVVSTENPYSFVAFFDRNLEAVFMESSTYPLLYSYNEGDHTATVIGRWEGVELTGELVIPETVMHNGEAYTVTAIGGWAFSECSGLTSLVIPSTVTDIGDHAFYGCSGIVGELVIPSSIPYISEGAFEYCRGITSVTYGTALTYIGNYAFRGCSSLASVELPNTLISIGEWAFSECPITSIVLPSSLNSIGNEAFRDCSGLTEIVIPNSVTSIGGINPFGGCSNLLQITVESGNAYYDSRDDSHAIIETATNKLVSGSLTTIIPNTVTSIGQNAFYSILVPSITIPESVNHIGPWAIGGINTLSSMTVLAEVPPTLDDCSFCEIDKSIPVYVPCSSIETYQITSGWNEFTNFIAVGNCSGMVTVTASPAEYGTVTGGGSFEGGETCTVSATPNEGYYFLCWMEDGQVVSTEATYTFPVYRDHNLTAIFYATLGDENIINGDFEQGNVGFTSEYNYNYDIGPGCYYVDNNASLHYGGEYQGFGHGGTGNFMIIDAATEPGVVVWSEQISVESNTHYTFSTWACALYPKSMASLQFSINDTPIGVCTAPSQTNTWKQFITTWYSGDSTTATITIVDLNTEFSGNDFGLDDISFRELDPSVNRGRGSTR